MLLVCEGHLFVGLELTLSEDAFVSDFLYFVNDLTLADEGLLVILSLFLHSSINLLAMLLLSFEGSIIDLTPVKIILRNILKHVDCCI